MGKGHILERAFAGVPVMVTGHTGFKGSWLSIWLRELGADVIGYSLEPPTEPGNFALCHLADLVHDIRADVRDFPTLQDAMARYQPRFVFHLAAQPLVLPSYEEPKETFDTNAGGTVNVLEAVRRTGSVRAVVCVTTDKVYENREWIWGYREADRLGGHDPYSSSKAMAELAIQSYRRSFFNTGYPAIASARAGNVIGGGDFSDPRLIPDCMRALMAGKPIPLRNPEHVRPWQHVLESLSAYLWLAVRLAEDGQRFAQAWNFAPWEMTGITTRALVEEAISLWGSGSWIHVDAHEPPKETNLLRLNWEKAAQQLAWQPVLNWQQALAITVAWFKSYHEGGTTAPLDMYAGCVAQIEAYTNKAAEIGVPWAA